MWIKTTGELIKALSDFPLDTPVMMADESIIYVCDSFDSVIITDQNEDGQAYDELEE